MEEYLLPIFLTWLDQRWTVPLPLVEQPTALQVVGNFQVVQWTLGKFPFVIFFSLALESEVHKQTVIMIDWSSWGWEN